MAKLIGTLSACIDCYDFTANGAGNCPDPDLLEAQIAAHLALEPGQHLVAGDDDGEHNADFSWAACECCGDRKGGSRHCVAILA